MPDKKIICLAVDDEPPALEVLKKYIAAVQTLELAGTCVDAIDAINFLQKHPVDLMFLDIKMPELLGTDFVRTLKNPPKVIFTTAYRKYAVEGFELDAADFLLKPISFDRFLKAVNKVMHTSLDLKASPVEKDNKKEAAVDSIYFRSDRKMVKVQLEDILYIESLKDYVKVVTVAQTIITRQSISAMEENLPKEKFVRVHRSFIVSLSKIESYTHDLIWVAKTELPVSRMYRHELEKILK
jgi:two-component system, LytTR family, response regulator